MGSESGGPEYGALLQESGEAGQKEASTEEPLTLGLPPGEEPVGAASFPVLSGVEDGMAGEPPAPPRRPRGRPRRAENAASAADPRHDRVLTIEARDEVQTAKEREDLIWHELQNAYWTCRSLTGTLDGVERTESGLTVAVVNYKGIRVAIPVKEMPLFTGKVPSGTEFQELISRMRGILTARLGSEIDYVVKGYENKSRSVVASRRDAMCRKRKRFYLDTDEQGQHMIEEGRTVQARVVAVADKVIRVDARSVFGEDRDNLSQCRPQRRYVGQVTDMRRGAVFVRLNIGVNAVAHTCYDMRMPGRKDTVSFTVTRLDEEKGIAIGIITRIIKQML